MHERPVVGSCELCARRYDLLIPDPGSRDLDFRRIEALFRHCPTCGLYVGRQCCWNPTAVMCVRCAAAPVLFGPPPSPASVAAPHGVLRDLSAALTGLAELEERIDASTNGDLEPALNAWEDAWLATGMLMTRVDSGRAAVAKQLRQPGVMTRSASRQLEAELQHLLDVYEGRSRRVARRLSDTGRELARHPRATSVVVDQPLADRRRPRVAALIVVAALVVLAAGVAVAAIDRLGILSPSDGTSDGPGLVVGGGDADRAPTPGAAGSTAPSGASSQPVEASITFDLLPVGPLAVEPPVVAVDGSPEVAAFPSPFDRSVRLAGSAPQVICLGAGGLRSAPASVGIDLYLSGPATSGVLRIGVVPGAGAPAVFELSLAKLAALGVDRWYRLEADWDGAQGVAIVVRERDRQRSLLEVPASRASGDPPSVEEATCIGTADLGTGSSLLIDNLSVAQDAA